MQLLHLSRLHLLLLDELIHLLLGEVPQGHGEQVVVAGASLGRHLLGRLAVRLLLRRRSRRLLRLGHLVETHGLELLHQHRLLLAADGELLVDNGEDEAHLVGQALELGLRLADQHGAAATVGGEAEGHERGQDRLRVGVLGDVAFLVEAVHVGGGHLAGELELLLDAFLLRRRHLLRRHLHHKVHGGVRVVLLVVRDEGRGVLLLRVHHPLEELLVVRRPRAQRKLGDHERGLILDLVLTLDVVPHLSLDHLLHDLTLEVAVPGVHALLLLVGEQPANVRHEIAGVVVGDGGGPTRANTVGAVDEHQRKDGQVVFGLDHLTVLVEVVQERVVALGEDGAADGRQPSEDVTGRRVVLAALEAGTELTGGHQEVDVVGSDEILRETDDGGSQGSLTVVVRGVLGDVTAELGHLDV